MKEGFYFVKWNATGEWDVAFYSDFISAFQVAGSKEYFDERSFTEIARIEPPTGESANVPVSARPKDLVDGESYQPFTVWEEVENTNRANKN